MGFITASVLSAGAGDGKQYRNSRDFAASIGLVPRQYAQAGEPIRWGSASEEKRTPDGCSYNVRGRRVDTQAWWLAP
ncbi:transposase (fragment) [Cupriavidus taiwanensis]|uniref:Transposase n=1 Tax=Cupriavidus taiwanensis TaxID=164546 RepID=A0A375JAM5_9BURK